jgi:hypothetical protein
MSRHAAPGDFEIAKDRENELDPITKVNGPHHKGQSVMIARPNTSRR